jgi:HK97 family phage portal protein
VSILSRLVSPPRGGEVEHRDLMSSAFVPPPQIGVLDDVVGVHKSMSHMTVFACVRLLADVIASLPWKAYRRDAKGVPKEIKPQPKLISQPYPGFDLFQWKWMCIASMALRGNSYHYITSRDNMGYPTALLPLHPDIVFLERRPDILLWFDPIYRIMGEPVPREDMVHMRRFTMPGEPWGLSPIKQAAIAIGMGLSAEEYGYRYFKESANPSGVLSTEQPLDEEAIQRVQKNWIQSHGGRRLPAMLTGGFKWQNLSITPEESQFLETREFQRQEICLLFGVPPVLIGDTTHTTAWGTGIQQINLGAIAYTFRPWTSCMESVISSCLPRGQFVRFDFKALMRGDIEGKYNAYKNGIQGTWLTPNEVRADEELDPIDGGDVLLQPANYVPLGTPTSLGGATGGATGPSPQPGGSPNGFQMPPVGGGENNGTPEKNNGKPIAAGRQQMRP